MIDRETIEGGGRPLLIRMAYDDRPIPYGASEHDHPVLDVGFVPVDVERRRFTILSYAQA